MDARSDRLPSAVFLEKLGIIMSTRPPTFLLALFSMLFLHSVLLGIHATRSPLAPALFVFGDSLMDAGNNNLLPTIARANFPPYGVDFSQGATGRFTNGRIIADLVAEYLGLPYPPPYIRFPKVETLSGYNYASGSCGILPETGKLAGVCLSMEDQINLFEKTTKSELEGKLKRKMSIYLAESIFLVSVGSNDLINNYLDPSLSRDTPLPLDQLLIQTLARQLERLYNLGARKLVMFEVGPIGCIPAVARRQKHIGQCVEDSNRFVSRFNDKLPSMLRNLTASLNDSIFVLGQTNQLSYDIIINPFRYGLEDSRSACCTTFENGTSGCIPLLKPCSNPDSHFFFDAYHLTEAAYSLIACQCITNSSICSPVSIKDLVEM